VLLPSGAGPVPAAEVLSQVNREGGGRAESSAADVELQMTVARLEVELGEVRAQLGQLAGARSAIGPAASPGGDAAAGLPGVEAAEEGALFAEVSRALAKIDEEKAAAARVKEIEQRKDEEVKAFKEYEEVQANLSERVDKLSESVPMSSADRRDLQSLMDLQVERMRELTGLWAGGEMTDDEVSERFMAERQEHRRAAIALLGESRIGGYQKFIQAGEVGGRYSFYTAPWETWTEE